ncbi:MAG: hypothetical protein V1897_14285 [Pseudomonadota bacterium]
MIVPSDASDRGVGAITLVIVVAIAVFYIGNYDIFSNHYIVNDDVRQQLFWMERWQDPELFQNDFLANYSEAYVPVGVKAIYRLGSLWFNPLQFSKVLTAILFVFTAVLWFVWGRLFGDNLTAFVVVLVYFLFTGFQTNMAGGLSRGFVFPLLIAYLYFISQGDIFKGGLVVLVQSFFNPYVFLLCLVTQAVVVSLTIGPKIFPKTFEGLDNIFSVLSDSKSGISLRSNVCESKKSQTAPEQVEGIGKLVTRHFILGIPVIVGVVFTAVNVLWYQSNMGHLISYSEMLGKSEYTEFGRYQLYPVPSFLYELIRPWEFNLSFPYWGPVAGWIMAVVTIGIFVYAGLNYQPVVKWKGLRGLFLIIPVSLFLYVVARLFLVKLFVPRRYLFYTLTIIYCIGFALALRIIVEKIQLSRRKMVVVFLALLVFASVKGRHIEFFDYSHDKSLYEFLQSIPKNVLIAGPPELMDNVMTFGKRRSFATYELSHTWVEPYWSEVKKRTFDLFRAYYSSSPEEIKAFCKSRGIDYLIIREEDFNPQNLSKPNLYFEPFNGFIWYLMNSNSTQNFAVLDRDIFPPVFDSHGIRVLRVR